MIDLKTTLGYALIGGCKFSQSPFSKQPDKTVSYDNIEYIFNHYQEGDYFEFRNLSNITEEGAKELCEIMGLIFTKFNDVKDVVHYIMKNPFGIEAMTMHSGFLLKDIFMTVGAYSYLQKKGFWLYGELPPYVELT